MPLSDISGSGSELSSRHIPDMNTLSNNSNASFSFQFPGTAPCENLLADEDENDFFRIAGGANVSLSLTHASPFSPAHTSPACRVERKGMVLGLHGVQTRKPEHVEDPPILSPVPLAVDNLDHKPSNQRPNLRLTTRPLIQASPEASFPLPAQGLPTSTMRDQPECVHSLLESKHTVIQVSDEPKANTRPTKKNVETKAKDRKKDLLHTQRKIIEGGIAKSRIATTKKTRDMPSRAVASSTLPPGSMQHSASSSPKRPALTEEPAAEALLADSSTSSIFPLTGIAGRLIQYGQNYMDPFRGQIDINVPNEKVTVNLDDEPDQTIHGVPMIQKTTQKRIEGPSNVSIFPMKGIADSLIHYRKKNTGTSPEKIGPSVSSETVSLDDFVLQPETITQATSIAQKTTQETNEEDDTGDVIEDDRSKPLTLSQLSPRKQRAQDKTPTQITTSATYASLPSPTRPATKRLMTTESASEEPKLKRSKGEPKTKERPTKPTVSERKPNSKPRGRSGTSHQTRKPSTTLSGSGSSSSLKKSDSSVTAVAPKPAAGIRRTKSRIVPSGKNAAVFNPGTGWNDNVRLLKEKDVPPSNSSLKFSGSSLQSSRIQNGQDDKALFPSLKGNGGQGALQSTQPRPEESDSRSTSRSHSNSQSQKHKFYHPAPNFKAIHAAFNASIAQRKENIHPTVPLPMRWETDSRMQERKKFEERVREKEREKEKEEEERRRFREAEEEQELKDLRKRMVIKAHEVPEWYNERPRTKKRQDQDVEN